MAGGVFVGREPELAELRSAADEALAGRGRLVLISGEPGIGKTRTAEELATYAQVRGAKVHWGRCHEGEGAPAYWPWVQVIRSYVREADPVALAWEMGGGAADIARVVPELAERLGEDVPEGTRTSRRPLPPLRRDLRPSSPAPPPRGRWWSSSTTCTGPTSHRCCCSSSSPAPSATARCW